MKKIGILSASGGMDSTSLLLKMLTENMDVRCISFNYGQKHKVELERVKKNIDYLKTKGFNIEHNVVDLSILGKLYRSALTTAEINIPEGHYEDQNMKATVVPNRNAIFSSIVYGYALSLVKDLEDTQAYIALGIHAGDHCFSRDTEILTPEGLKTIDELKVGDKIFSFNIENDQMEEDIIIDLMKKNVVTEINLIETLSGILKLTDEHNVFVKTLDGIEKVKVKDLVEGNNLVGPYEDLTMIKKITVIPYNDHVFDISVEKNHNFFAGNYGQHLISNSIYPDCTPEFRDTLGEAFRIGNWNSEKVEYYTPYIYGNKLTILEEAITNCEKLGLEFETIFLNTNTCYNPNSKGESCGKCGSCQERLLAFNELGRKDPVTYSQDYDSLISNVLDSEEKFKKV